MLRAAVAISIVLFISGAAGDQLQSSDPDVAVSPSAFHVNAFTGEIVPLGITIENQGTVTLVWQLASAESAVTSLDVHDLSGVHVLLDKAHGQNTGGHSEFLDSLTQQGATVTENTSPLTPALLSGFDVFWTLEMTTDLLTAEKSALHDWVRRGGGMLLQGDNAGTRWEFNDLLSGLGTGVTYDLLA